MATINLGPKGWKCSRDKDGYVEYRIKYRVRCDDPNDGPATALACPGLPQPGDPWVIGNDIDLWATCRQDATVTPVLEDEPNRQFDVEFIFSTKPPETSRCSDTPVQDPLLEPPQVSGGFTKYTEEATTDRFGRPILSSSHEMLRGPQAEFDQNRPTIKIQANVASFDLVVLACMMVDHVNDADLWGFSRRCVKLSNVSWDRKFYGQCYYYYALTLEFDIRADGFDRNILDEGSKVLQGHWDEGDWVLDYIDGAPPDPDNPAHFIRFTDRQGNPCHVVLNGNGEPAEVVVSLSGYIVSVADGNVGNDLADGDFWVPLTDTFNPAQLTGFPAWSDVTTYPRGAVVSLAPAVGPGVAAIYLSLTDNNLDDQPPSAAWQALRHPPLADRGDYDPAASYDLGDFVRDSIGETAAGYIHVEKYDEADFLLLGIPTVF